MTRRLSDRSLLFDVGLVVALLILGLVELYLRPVSPDGSFPRGGDLWGALATATIVAPLLWRRRFPIWVLAASGAAYFAALLLGYEPTGATNTAELVAVYGVGVYAARPAADLARWIGGALFAGGFLWAFAIGRYRLVEIALMFLTWVGIAIFGETVYVRRRYQEALEGRARQLEAEQEERARLILQEERARISREFHDIWAHTLSLVVVQAGAAEEVFDESPELARQALSTIQQEGKRALAEVRRLIASDATETSPSHLDPVPGLGDLDRLVEELGRAGIPVALSITGPTEDLPGDVGLSAYRIVQQALTNTLSHGGPGVRARVEVRRADGELLIDVVDDGHGLPAAPEPARRGRGLIGMRERVALFGGDLVAGPRPEGGFAVHARIPVETDQ